MKPIVIGIAGGSGSGKSTVTDQLIHLIDPEKTMVIKQDNYYKDQSHLPFEERVKTNYDHPLAFDNDLLIDQIKKLKSNQSVQMPEYDFSKHNRKPETVLVQPREVILLEGILIFVEKKIRDLMDIKIFVDTDSDVRILRRIQRDMKDRARSLDSIIFQYLETVRPAHLQFVEPSKRYADLIVPEGGHNKVAIELLEAKINYILQKNSELS